MNYLLIFLLCLYSVVATAQDCDPATLKTMPGKWLPQPGDEIIQGTSRPSVADAVGAKKILDRIRQQFQEQYRPFGADVYHHYTHNIYPGSSAYGNGYIYTIRNFLFYCSGGKKMTNSEGVGSYIYVNRDGTSYSQFREIPVYDPYGKVNSEVVNNGGFYSLSGRECPGGKLPDLSDGYFIFDNGSDYSVWITYEGKQPYRYVSRKEFLEKQVAICEANLKELSQHYSSSVWEEQLKMFAEHKEKMLEDKKKHLSIYERPLEAYRQDLKKEAAWLNEMAVVKYIGSSEMSRFVFTTPDDGYMFVPIMPDSSYYDRTLPKWAPQFIQIEITAADSFFSKNVRKVVDDNIAFFKSLLTNR